MSGLNLLNQFPEEIKEKIIAEFGSIQDLYKKIFDLYQRQHSLYKIKPLDNQKVANIDKTTANKRFYVSRADGSSLPTSVFQFSFCSWLDRTLFVSRICL